MPYVICDVFTDRALTGNPLAVFTDARGLDAGTMQQLALELNLSETTFILPPERGGTAKVRIYMPTRELPFAGHPTLGTAYILALASGSNDVELELPVGNIPVSFTALDDGTLFGSMVQPTPTQEPFKHSERVLAALGITRSELPVEQYVNGPRHVCVFLDSHEAVSDLHPNYSALARIEGGVAIFHFDGSRCTARYFAAHAGINEDPATGSAAGPLAMFLTKHGRLPVGQSLTIEQGLEMKRPSKLLARITREADATKVEVGGSTVVVAQGEFTLDLPPLP